MKTFQSLLTAATYATKAAQFAREPFTVWLSPVEATFVVVPARLIPDAFFRLESVTTYDPDGSERA